MTKHSHRGFTSTSKERRESESFHGVRAFVKQARRGFTLIEIIMTLGILAAALASYSATVYGVTVSNDTRSQETALRAATDELESLRGDGYAALTPGVTFFSGSVSTLLPNGRGTVTVSDFDPGTKRVNVTVTWSGPSSVRNVSLDTLISETGLR